MCLPDSHSRRSTFRGAGHNLGGARRVLSQHSGDRLRTRGALATPNPASLRVNDADLCLLLRHVQTYIENHRILHPIGTGAEPDLAPMRLGHVIAPPALGLEQCRDPPIAIAPEALSKIDDVRSQRRLVVGRLHRPALRRAVLIQHPTARRCETFSCDVMCTTQARRRAALRSFPTQLP
jgi:hypothetical protein